MQTYFFLKEFIRTFLKIYFLVGMESSDKKSTMQSPLCNDYSINLGMQIDHEMISLDFLRFISLISIVKNRSGVCVKDAHEILYPKRYGLFPERKAIFNCLAWYL